MSPTPMAGATAPDAEPAIKGLVKRVARPLVREWLDANMPRLLARALEKEMEERARDKSV